MQIDAYLVDVRYCSSPFIWVQGAHDEYEDDNVDFSRLNTWR